MNAAAMLVSGWCAFWALAFVALYFFSPWYRSVLGRLVMSHAASLALILSATFVTNFVRPFTHLPAWVYAATALVCFGLVGLSTFAMTVYLAFGHSRILRARRRSE